MSILRVEFQQNFAHVRSATCNVQNKLNIILHAFTFPLPSHFTNPTPPNRVIPRPTELFTSQRTLVTSLWPRLLFTSRPTSTFLNHRHLTQEHSSSFTPQETIYLSGVFNSEYILPHRQYEQSFPDMSIMPFSRPWTFQKHVIRHHVKRRHVRHHVNRRHVIDCLT